MRIGAGVTSIFKFLAATIGVVLPACPVVVCLVLRGAEGWKLWNEMNHFSALGLLAWLWTLAYLSACAVTIFAIDDERNLRWWEFLINAGNLVTSCILAMKCAKQPFDGDDQMPYAFRFVLWLGICLIAQLTVAFVARRARRISQRLYRKLNSKPLKAVRKSSNMVVAVRSQTLTAPPAAEIGATIGPEPDRATEALVS
jgi:hypothetical protein